MASKSTNPGKRVSVNLVIAIMYLHGKSAAPQSSPDTRLCSVVQLNLRAAMDAQFLRACQDAVVRSAYDLREQNDRGASDTRSWISSKRSRPECFASADETQTRVFELFPSILF